MNEQSKKRSRKPFGAVRAQAMVEFAIALPVLLMLLIGIMEVGRLIFMYTMAINSSRDAVRYASAYGRSDEGFLKYSYCAGIRQNAKLSGFFLNLQDADIDIDYDSGPGTSLLDPNGCDAASGEDPQIVNLVDTEDRVTVTVTVDYEPMLSLLPIPSRTITSTSSRTILGILELDN